jgi:hypothetical protein
MMSGVPELNAVKSEPIALPSPGAVGHGDDDRLLQAEYVAHIRIIRERTHDRQLGGSRIAEEVGDALGLQ